MKSETQEGKDLGSNALLDKRSARDHGPFSAYCKVCWNPCYIFWIDTEPHGGVCMFGHERAGQCPDAMAAAKNTAAFRRINDFVSNAN